MNNKLEQFQLSVLCAPGWPASCAEEFKGVDCQGKAVLSCLCPYLLSHLEMCVYLGSAGSCCHPGQLGLVVARAVCDTGR